MKKQCYLASVLLITAALCSYAAPSSSPQPPTSLVGSVSVGPFTYLPAKTNKLAPNQADSIGGPLPYGRAIDAYVRDAVVARLQVRGIRLDGTGKVLSGEIEQCRVVKYKDAATDCLLVIKYRVSAGAAVEYEATKEVSTRKTFDPQLALEEVIEHNVAQLLADSAFLKAIE